MKQRPPIRPIPIALIKTLHGSLSDGNRETTNVLSLSNSQTTDKQNTATSPPPLLLLVLINLNFHLILEHKKMKSR